MIDALRRLRGSVVLIAVGLALVSARASATCRPSANGSHSFDSRLSPIAGQVCRMTVAVFAGASCAEPALWQVRLPCDQASQTAISNQGRLISILLPRTKSLDLNVIRITWSSEKFALANLRKLVPKNPPARRGPPRLRRRRPAAEGRPDAGASVRDRPQADLDRRGLTPRRAPLQRSAPVGATRREREADAAVEALGLGARVALAVDDPELVFQSRIGALAQPRVELLDRVDPPRLLLGRRRSCTGARPAACPTSRTPPRDRAASRPRTAPPGWARCTPRTAPAW